MLVLAKFDVRAGHRIVWSSEPIEPASLPGIEFKMIPSGLHDTFEDTIYFICGKSAGCAVYAARTPDQTSQTVSADRQNVHMYSFAYLVPGDTPPWSWETYLRHELAKFMDVRDVAVLKSSVGSMGAIDTKCHPVLSAKSFIQSYGALCFELWKAGLSRQRLLLAHPAATPHHTASSLRELSQHSYLASRICSIPTDVLHLIPEHHQREVEYTCYYNVGLQDMPRLQKADSFVGTTSDGLLLSPSREACDIWTDSSKIYLSDGSQLRPTWRDLRRFSKLIESLDIPYDPPSRHDGNASWGGIMDRLVDSTASGLIWWASAGESAIMDWEERDQQPLIAQKPDGVALVGYFQQCTRQLIRVLSKLCQDDDGMILVGPEHIAAMGLDPVAAQDRRFLQRFSLIWWDRPVCFRTCCCCG